MGHPKCSIPALLALIIWMPFTTAAAVTDAGMKSAADYSESHKGQTFLVMVDGKTVFERYADGGAVDRPQMLASGSKSLVGLAAAAAVGDGLVKLDDPACNAIAEWKDDAVKSKIKYRQLLSLTSGLTPGERGMAVRAPAWKQIAAKPMTGKPGEQFDYGAYQINTFGYALERLLKTETFEAYLKRRVLDPIGVKVDWRFKCDDGHPQLGGGAFVTARDWALIGRLVAQGGRWNDKPVIDPKRLSECFTGSDLNAAYGLTWWLRKPVTADQRQKIPLLRREWAEVADADWLPADLVAACGAGNQRLYVVPSMKLVVVRQGTFGTGFSDAELLSRLLRDKSVRMDEGESVRPAIVNAMPIHDWSRVDAGSFHHFHQGWITEIATALNGGELPTEYFALAEPMRANVEPVAVGDPLPSLPIFLDGRTYVPAPLGPTYELTWSKCPAVLRETVSP